MPRRCPACGGTGEMYCAYCSGDGCRYCRGDGSCICPYCDGYGWIGFDD